MEQTTPKIITDTPLSKHHFNSDDFDIYEDNGTYILVAKVKLPKVKKLELSGEEVNKKYETGFITPGTTCGTNKLNTDQQIHKLAEK